VWRCLSGLRVTEALRELLRRLEEEGCAGRVVRFNDTVDLGRIGPRGGPGWPARESASACRARETALIHRRDLSPLANLELYSVAPGGHPGAVPACSAPTPRGTPRARPPDPGPQSVHRRGRSRRANHTTVIALMALERAWVRAGAPAEELSQEGLR